MSTKILIIKKFILVYTLVLLSACQQAPVTTEQANQRSLYSINTGSILALRQDLVIPPKAARVYFQYGKQITLADIDKYQAWCEFEIKTLSENPQTVNAGNFPVTKFVNERTALIDGAGFGSLTHALEEFSSTFYLQSATQPDVFRLSCLRRRGNRMQTYLSYNDMHAALGNVMSLELK
jgi:hypothetical protein